MSNETISIDKAALIKSYNSADAKGKALLVKLHGKEVFEKSITERVKTFEDACKIVGITPSTVFTKADNKDDVAFKKLKVIAAALNQGWKPDWKNGDEYKYYPWFDLSSGFELVSVDSYCQGSDVSSRLCFVSEDLARYAGTQFLSLYKDYMTA